MGAHPVLEPHRRQGHVCDTAPQICTPDGRHCRGHAADNPQDRRDGMRCKAPENVLLAADLGKAQSIRKDVVEVAEIVFDEFEQSSNAGVVLQDVADHQDCIGIGCDSDELFTLRYGQRKWLLHEHVSPTQERALSKDVMNLCGRCNYERRAVGNRIFKLRHQPRPWGDRPRALATCGPRLAHGCQSSQLRKVADEVLTPIAAADDYYAQRGLFLRVRSALARTNEAYSPRFLVTSLVHTAWTHVKTLGPHLAVTRHRVCTKGSTKTGDRSGSSSD